MIKFYKGMIERTRLGTAVEVREPYLEGKVIDKIRNLQERDRELLYVIECEKKQHLRILARGNVKELDKDDAVTLGAQYHPARKVRKRVS